MIEKLIPPSLDRQSILRKIVCTRPMREDKFNISAESLGSKQVIHCYGHGGAGWTTLFGSVHKAIGLFLSHSPSKSEPIRIVGAGCMGLAIAAELSHLGYRVSGITAKSLYDTSSWKAAGYFGLVSVKTTLDEQENLYQLGFDTLTTLKKIEKGTHPYLGKGAVKPMPVYCSEETESGIELLEERGIIPPRQHVTLDFGNGVMHPHFVKCMTYFMNATSLMRQLINCLNESHISIQIKALESLEEVNEKIIFNCTGMGAKELIQDERLLPVRGHLLLLDKKVESRHMDYMIYTSVKQDGKDEYVYLFPKSASVTPDTITGEECAGVIGGTFITNFEKLSPSALKEQDIREFARLYERNRRFFWGGNPI